VISFKLAGAPEFAVHVESEKVHLEEGKATNPDVVIEGSLPLSFLVIKGSMGFGDLAKAWLTGKVKVKKGLIRVFRIRKVFKLFQIALEQRTG
jgi:putative sterol carrier protein